MVEEIEIDDSWSANDYSALSIFAAIKGIKLELIQRSNSQVIRNILQNVSKLEELVGFRSKSHMLMTNHPWQNHLAGDEA